MSTTKLSDEQVKELARVNNLEEINRRKEASSRLQLRKYDSVENVVFRQLPREFRDHEVGVVVFMMAGPEMQRPRCDKVAINFLAYFGGDREDDIMNSVKQYVANTIVPAYNTCDIRLMYVDKWALLAATPGKMTDQEYSYKRMEENALSFFNLLRRNQRSFVSKLEEATGKEVPIDGETEEEKQRRQRSTLKTQVAGKLAALEAKRMSNKTKVAMSGKQQDEFYGTGLGKVNKEKVSARRDALKQNLAQYPSVPPLPAGLLRPKQAVAAVCFLEDQRSQAKKLKITPEPMVRVLKVYSSFDEAKKDVEENLKEHVLDFDIDIVDLGEWLFPWDVDFEKLENFAYRDSEQNKIMHQKNQNKKDVSSFRKKCTENNIQQEDIVLQSLQDMEGEAEVDVSKYRITEPPKIMEAKIEEFNPGDEGYSDPKRDNLEIE